MNDVDKNENESPGSTGNHNHGQLFAPQKPWHLGLLTIASCSLYLFAWLYRHAYNIKQLDKAKWRPWLWVLVLLFPIAIPFALNRMFSGFERVAKENSTRWNGDATLSGIIAFLALASMRWTERLDIAVSIFVLQTIVLALTFMHLTAQLNRFYATLPDRSFRSSRYRFTWPSRIVVLIAGPVFAIFIGAGLQADWNRYLRPTLPIGETYQVQQLPVSIKTQDRWSIVASGTVSDGEAALELIGAIGNTFALVFDEQNNRGIDTIIEARRRLIYANNPEAICEGTRELDPVSFYRRGELSCVASGSSEQILWRSVVVEDDSRTYELIGETRAPESRIAVAEGALDRLAASFGLLRGEQ